MYTNRKSYLLTGGEVPRSTAYRHKKRAELDACQARAETSQQTYDEQQPRDAVESIDETQEHSQQGVPGAFPMLSSSDSDTEVIFQRPAKKKCRKRKVPKPRSFTLSGNNDSPSDIDQATTTSSSESVSTQESAEFCSRSPSPVPDSDEGLNEHDIPKEEACNQNGPGVSRVKNTLPLCPCTETTVDDVIFMTLSLGLRHGLSWEAQVDILQMIDSIYEGSKIPKSKGTYLKDLFAKKDNIKYHIFCDDCHCYIGKRSDDTKVKSVLCNICSKELLVTSPSNSFVTLSIKSQLEIFLQDDNFVSKTLTYRFNRQCSPGDLSDVYDGEAYKKLSSDGGILSSPFNFSFNFFTDGVAFGKSNKTIWPIYLTINELPYEERSKYVILAALYVRNKDPKESYFLKPFVEEANLLSSEGITWNYQGNLVNSKVVPLCFVADSVARFQMLNMQAHNAFYGCTFCYHKAESVRGGVRHTVGPAAELRTSESWKSDLIEVYNRRNEIRDEDRVFRGVKGACNLFHLNYFSISNVVVDYMHAICVGCVKTHMEFLLEACGSTSGKQVWIGLDNVRISKAHVVNTVDDRMRKMQGSTAAKKQIQLLSTMAKSWKCREYLNWLMFYAIPCLTGLLKEKYLAHFAMLSAAMHLLLQKNVKDVEEAHKLLVMYSFYFQKYFGKENMFYNFHLLSHISFGVLRFGPIWGHNCFLYESQNRLLLQLCKSASNVAYQICHKFMIYKSLPLLHKNMVSSRAASKFFQKILNYKHLVTCVRSNDDQCILHGSPRLYVLTDADKSRISQCLNVDNIVNCFSYPRMTFKKQRFTTESYSERMTNGKILATNDAYAFLSCGQSVVIHQIINVPDLQKVILLVQKIKLSKRAIVKYEDFHYNFLHKIEEMADCFFVRLEILDRPAYFLKGSDGNSFLSGIPYGCTVE